MSYNPMEPTRQPVKCLPPTADHTTVALYKLHAFLYTKPNFH